MTDTNSLSALITATRNACRSLESGSDRATVYGTLEYVREILALNAEENA